jgi:DNA gyrase/topoisomerase IV subunit A
MDDREREAAQQRLQVLELVEAALGRRDEVFAVVDAAADEDEAEQRIRELFEVQEPYIARAVLDLQVRRWTRSQRERIAAQVAELRHLLDE